MATVVTNKPDYLEFKNVVATESAENAPTVTFQLGDWAAENHIETGIAVDVYGAELPLLSAANARKLAKWLTRAADEIDGGKLDKKRKPRYDNEDDDQDFAV